MAEPKSTPPIGSANLLPHLPSFSTAMTARRTAIQVMLSSPNANISNIIAQLLPTVEMP